MGHLGSRQKLCCEEKLLGLIIQGSFAKVFAVELFDWELNLVPAALFLHLSSTNLMRINKLNTVLLFNKDIAGLTVSPAAFADVLDFLFQAHSVLHRAGRADSGTCVLMFRPVLKEGSLFKLSDLRSFYYFLTSTIIYFGTSWHGWTFLFGCALLQHVPFALTCALPHVCCCLHSVFRSLQALWYS